MEAHGLVRPVGVWLRARRRHVTRGAAVAGMLGVCMCAVAVFQGTQRQDELGQQHHNALLNRFAELAPATRKAQLGIMLASVEKFTHHLNDRQQLDVPAASNLCEKKDFIINKFDSLLKKLIGDDKNLNITDTTTEQEYEDAMKAWLDTESVYRLATQTHKESNEAATYALKKLAVEMQVNKLTKEKVAEVIKNYPIQKAEIDGERSLILELIKLVEELAGGSHSEGTDAGAAAAKTPVSTLAAIQAKLAALGKAAEGPNGSKKLEEGLKVVEAKMMASYTSAKKLQGIKFTTTGSTGSSMLAPSPEEMEATKNEVKTVLLELLQDPDFRAFMLKMGMMDLLSTLTVEKETLQKDKEVVADLSNKADEAGHTEKSTDLERGAADGEKTTKEEEYKDEHAAFIQTGSNVLKEIYIIKQIKMKIISYCTTGSWNKSQQARLSQDASDYMI